MINHYNSSEQIEVLVGTGDIDQHLCIRLSSSDFTYSSLSMWTGANVMLSIAK